MGRRIIWNYITKNWYVAKTEQIHVHTLRDISVLQDWMLSYLHNGFIFAGRKASIY